MTKAITKNSKKGFTLVELVVVIAILAILAAIAIPVVNSIINTASKNGALSNAQTIELAIKECQADIAAKNDEVYDGATNYSFVDPSGATVAITTGVPSAANAATAVTISVQDVAGIKGISDAFETVTYNGVEYVPFWDEDADKCVYLDNSGATPIELETGASYPGTNTTQLATAGVISTATISSL